MGKICLTPILIFLTLSACSRFSSPHAFTMPVPEGKITATDSLFSVFLNEWRFCEPNEGAMKALELFHGSAKTITSPRRVEFVAFFLDAFLQDINDYTRMTVMPTLENFTVQADFDSLNQKKLLQALSRIKNGASSILYLVCAKHKIEQAKPLIKQQFNLHKSSPPRLDIQYLDVRNPFWAMWHSAVALTQMEQNDTMVHFLIQTAKGIAEKDRQFVSQTLCYDLCKLKSREITNYVIDEFALSDKCYGGSFDELAYCEMYNLFCLPIKEVRMMLEKNPSSEYRITQQWLRANRDKWTYEE